MIAGGTSDKTPGAPGGAGTQFIFDAGSADGFPGGADMIAWGMMSKAVTASGAATDATTLAAEVLVRAISSIALM